MTAEHPQVNFRATCADCDGDTHLPYTAAVRPRARMAAKAHVIDHPDHETDVERIQLVADGGMTSRVAQRQRQFHGVCRDCPDEWIGDCVSVHRAAEYHSIARDHRVEVAEVTP